MIDPPPLAPNDIPAGSLAESRVPEVMSEVARSGSLAESNVPDVILDAARFGISLALRDNLSEEMVPEVILDAARFGISLADKDNLADGTVPLPNSDAFNDVRDAPEPSSFRSVPDAAGNTITAELPTICGCACNV